MPRAQGLRLAIRRARETGCHGLDGGRVAAARGDRVGPLGGLVLDVFARNAVELAGSKARVQALFVAAPALVERPRGKGRVLVWTSSMDLSWNDLAQKPVYLPFLHGVVRHLAAYTEAAPWMTIGQVVDPTRRAGPGSSVRPEVALTPSGGRLPLDGEDAQVLELTEQGFYEIRGRSQGAPAVVVASNVDTSESDLTPMDPREIVAAATASAAAEQSRASGEPPTPEAQERMQRIWWYLLLAGILLLGADTLLSNRLSKA